jgi:hypothetical protein
LGVEIERKFLVKGRDWRTNAGKSPLLEYEKMGSGPILAFKNGAVLSRKVYEFWCGNWVTYD